jgi:hypothetical protein
MWQELGIAATTDIAAIRRAYAGRLRLIDVDRDPAVFQRLRQAFEAALREVETRQAREAADPPEEDDADPLPEATATIPQAAPDGSEDADAAGGEIRLRQLRYGIQRALAKGDSERALAQATEAMAQGLMSLDEQEDLGTALMTVAVEDRHLPAEHFRLMAQIFGWGRPKVGDADMALRERVASRLEAEAWYSSLCDATIKQRWATYEQRQERLLARILLGQVSLRWVALIHSGFIRWWLAPYDRHEPWLGDRVDRRRFTRLRAALTSQPRHAIAMIWWGLNVAFMGLLMVVFALPYRGRTYRRVAPAPVDRGIPTGLAALRALSGAVLGLVFHCVFYGAAAVIVLAIVAAAILFPPLGAAIVIGRFIARRKKK